MKLAMPLRATLASVTLLVTVQPAYADDPEGVEDSDAILVGRPSTAPLPIRTQSPLLRGAYLPLPVQSPGAGSWQFATGVQWSNTVNAGTAPGESYLVDGEAVELDLALVGSRGAWRFRAGVPVSWRGAGTLDSFIESWHDLFGLPDGIRPQRPRDEYAIRYSRAGGPTIDAEGGTALGDVQLEAGRVLYSREDRELTAWVGVELPTGKEAQLTGNGATDVAAWLAGRVALGDRFELSGQAGAAVPGGDAPLPYEDVVGFGTLALGWHATTGFTALVQLDAHSRIARDSQLKFLDSAVLLTLGGRMRFVDGYEFEAGVTEDIAVDRSPDVSFYLGFRWPVFR